MPYDSREAEDYFGCNQSLIVIPIKQTELPRDVYRCHQCGGTGSANDGSLAITSTEIRMVPSRKCQLCRGSGHIRICPA